MALLIRYSTGVLVGPTAYLYRFVCSGVMGW